MPTTLLVNNFTLNPSSVHALPFYGKLSSKELPAMQISFHISGAKSVEAVENLLSQDTVQVNDPFTMQTYPASFQLLNSSYRNDPSERDYTCQITALDIAPKYDALEINGEVFPVLKSEESITTDQDQEGIYRVILLRLTYIQFATIEELLKRDEPLSIKRIGVDKQPLTVRSGSRMYWSKHTEDGEVFYKKIVRLVQPSNFPSGKIGLALQTDQDILFRMMISLFTRFERLANELVVAGTISNEKRATLLGENWNELLEKQNINEIIRETYRITDAEEELG